MDKDVLDNILYLMLFFYGGAVAIFLLCALCLGLARLYNVLDAIIPIV